MQGTRHENFSERLTSSQVLECAPLVLEDYVETFTNASQAPPLAALQEYAPSLTALNTSYLGFLYGENTMWDMDYTFVYFGDLQFGNGMGNTVAPFQV